jgi:hypothetical protein
MTNFALVNMDTETVVAGKDKPGLTFNGVAGRLRIVMPDDTRRAIQGGSPGDIIAGPDAPEPDPDDDDPPPPPIPYTRFKLYEVLVASTGAGDSIASKSDPVFDPVADTVTVTNTMEPTPVQSDDDAHTDFSALDDHTAKVLKRVIKLLNDGTFVPGGNLTSAQLKTMFKLGLGG